jgi:hypothetical protein
VHPSVDVAERLRTQGVETSLALGTDSNESPVVENPKMPGNPRLTDAESGDESPYRTFTSAQLLDDPEASRVRQDLEG